MLSGTFSGIDISHWQRKCIASLRSRIAFDVQTPVTGWLEAFAAHPRIGDLDALRKKFGDFGRFSEREQGGSIVAASDDVLKELQEWNKMYESKFGHIFIVCAKGKTAPEMLQMIKFR